MAKSFSQANAAAWAGLAMQSQKGRTRVRFERAEYDELKAAYVGKYGYNITVPGWDDIVRLKPNLLKTPDEIKAEKMRNLERMLASPNPEFYNNYASVMTWIDNIQDTASAVFPAFRILARWSPKLIARLIPGMGWALLGYDALQLANVFGRAPWKVAMGAKRAACELLRSNPFTKKAQWKRMDRIAKWDPTIADLLQVFQTTSDVTGVGLSFGPIMGFMSELASGAYRSAIGQRVSFGHDLPPMKLWELNAAAGMKAAAMIGTAGQTFSEDLHFWSYATFAASTYFLTPYIEQEDVAGAVEDPLEAIVPAPEPEDQITREVIEEAGLSIAAGVGWPYLGKGMVPLREVQHLVMDKGQTGFYEFCNRHPNDSYGMLAGSLLYDSHNDLFDALEPGAEHVEEDSPVHRVFFSMLKAPLLPDQEISKEQGKAFAGWIEDYTEIHERVPTMREVKLHLDVMRIKWRTFYPLEMDPAYKHFWPAPFDDSSAAGGIAIGEESQEAAKIRPVIVVREAPGEPIHESWEDFVGSADDMTSDVWPGWTNWPHVGGLQLARTDGREGGYCVNLRPKDINTYGSYGRFYMTEPQVIAKSISFWAKRLDRFYSLYFMLFLPGETHEGGSTAFGPFIQLATDEWTKISVDTSGFEGQRMHYAFEASFLPGSPNGLGVLIDEFNAPAS